MIENQDLAELSFQADRLADENMELRAKCTRLLAALMAARDPHAAKWRLQIIDKALGEEENEFLPGYTAGPWKER